LEATVDRKEIALTLGILRRDRLSIVGMAVAVLFIGTSIAVMVFGNSLVPYNPTKVNLSSAFQPPSFQHFFGTDNFGRDIFSRCVIAAPVDAEIGFTIVVVSILIGGFAGSCSGYFGGRVDDILMRTTQNIIADPTLVLAVAIGVALGPGVEHVIEANLVGWWPIYARLARAGALSLKESQFVEAAKVDGLSRYKIILKHIIPNNFSPLLVYGTLDIGNAILYASVLSYLGLGAQPPQAEWGRMVFDGQLYLINAWWMSILPGVVIFIVALGFNLLGDGARDAFDPRYRK
jgi:peptide/nickel transport system permease protein